jgi:hypothetical protein
MDMPLSLASIWREWRHLIVLGSCIVGFVIFFQFWFRYQEMQPIVIEYKRYLDYLVAHSPKARTYETEYFRTHGRDTVASKHFEHVCAAMTGLAVEDGFAPAAYPDFPAQWCFERSAYFSEFLQPR